MKIPYFIKELLWSFYLPKYAELSNKPFRKSLKYMSKVLLIAFIISGFLYLPKVLMLKGTIEDELSKFESFKISGNVTQTAPLTIPRWNPWVVVDLSNELELTKEMLVIDKNTVKYRVFRIGEIPRDQLKDIASYKTTVSLFLTILLLLMLPGIAILLYVRLWLKYFLLTVIIGTLFFVILDLTRWRLKWKQMLSVAAHAGTAVIIIEVISAYATTIFLLPIMKFVGLNIYIIGILIWAGMMIYGIIGSQVGK